MSRAVRIVNLAGMFVVGLGALSSLLKPRSDGAELAGALFAIAACFYPLYAAWSALGSGERRKLRRAFVANVLGIAFFALVFLVVVVFQGEGSQAFFIGALALVTPFVVNVFAVRRLLAKENVETGAAGLPASIAEADEPVFVDTAAMPETEGNYLVRHWRGDLPLGQSYWVNGALVGVATAIAIAVAANLFDEQSDSLRTVAFIGLGSIALSLLVWVWSVVGIWRSANRHAARGGTPFWAGAARIMVVIGILTIAGRVATTIGPQAKELALIAVGEDPMGTVDVMVSKDKQSLVIQGALREGAAMKVKAVLDEHPAIRVVALNSNGGRMLEARQIAGFVRSRGLDTYVQGRCESACTFVFLAGRDRASTPNARIGFHQPTFAGMDAEAQRRSTEEMARIYREARLPDSFIRRVSATAPADMWYPGRDELIAANVVTRLSLGGEVPMTATTIASRSELLLAVRAIPLWQTMEKHYPEVLKEAIDMAWAVRERGGTDGEMTDAMRSAVARIYPVLLKNADDKTLDEFVDVLTYQMSAARALSAEACGKLLASQLDITQTLPKEASEKEQRFLIRAMSAPPHDGKQLPSQAQVQDAMRAALAGLPDIHVHVMGNQNTYKNQPALLCDAMIAFYRAVAALPEQQRHVALRGMFQS